MAPSTATLGLPSFLPLARAFLIPALTRCSQTVLKLRDGAEDGKHHFAGGRAGVHLLRQGNEVNAEGLERSERTKQVRS